MGHAQSDFVAASVQPSAFTSPLKNECQPGTLVLNAAEIPSKPLGMNGSASERSLHLSQSMPDPTNPASTSSTATASSSAANADSTAEHAHFPQRRREHSRSKASKLNMKRSGSHPNSLARYVQDTGLGTVRNATVIGGEMAMQTSRSEAPKSPETRSPFDCVTPKTRLTPRKVSFAISEEDSAALAAEDSADAGSCAADSMMKAEKVLEEKSAGKTLPALPEVQMKDHDDSQHMDTSSSSSSPAPSTALCPAVPETVESSCTSSVCSMNTSTESIIPLSPYCYHYSREGLLYFFDWDDTLLCSSYLRHLNYSLHSELDEMEEEFRQSLFQLDAAISNVLSTLFNSFTKNVFIITNSESGWVERSAMKFLPKTAAFFSEVNFFSNILSARDIYCRTVPEAASKYAQCLKNLQSNNAFYQTNNLAHINAAMSQPLQWKEFVFEKTIREWIKENERVQLIQANGKISEDTLAAKKAQVPLHVVCMGDTVERTAIINALSCLAGLDRAPVSLFPAVHNGTVAGGTAENSDSQPVYGPSVDEAFEICKQLTDKRMVLKSIKFPERPHVTQLEKQINLIASVLNYLSTHTQPLDLYLSLAVMNNNNQSNANGNAGSANSPNSAGQSKPCNSSTMSKSDSSNSCRMKESATSAVQTTEVAV